MYVAESCAALRDESSVSESPRQRPVVREYASSQEAFAKKVKEEGRKKIKNSSENS
jgi:hypothetical protein